LVPASRGRQGGSGRAGPRARLPASTRWGDAARVSEEKGRHRATDCLRGPRVRTRRPSDVAVAAGGHHVSEGERPAGRANGHDFAPRKGEVASRTRAFAGSRECPCHAVALGSSAGATAGLGCAPGITEPNFAETPASRRPLRDATVDRWVFLRGGRYSHALPIHPPSTRSAPPHRPSDSSRTRDHMTGASHSAVAQLPLSSAIAPALKR
jgi:hypothetical protein